MSVPTRRRARQCALFGALAICHAARPGAVHAQSIVLEPQRSWLEATAGSELETYLRALALDTSVTHGATVSARPFSADQLRRAIKPGADHPWARAFGPPSPAAHRRFETSIHVLRPDVKEIWNSTFPFGINEGAVWAGRGLTSVASAGVYATAGPIHLRLEPLAFRAENEAFPLADNGLAGDQRFRDPVAPNTIDQPQRFGTGPVQRVDLGESELGASIWYASFGVSNAREIWGPAETHPLILGANAPGFPHAYVGTSRPLPIGIGKVHFRSVLGRLYETQWSPAPDSLSRRLVSALVAVFEPRGIDGLEIGGTRFFHRRLIGSVPRFKDFFIPVDGLLFKINHVQVDNPSSAQYTPDNQVASVFARWAVPSAGFEIYGEYGRNDAAYDARELLVEPDHASAYMIGMHRLWGVGGATRSLFRLEWLDTRTTNIQRVRPQALFYDHNILLQGHTNRGKVLGSVAMMGGGGVSAGFDRYETRGKTTIEFHRLGRLMPYGEGVPTPRDLDVQHVLSVERTRFHDDYDLAVGGSAIWEANRNFTHDAFGLRLDASVKMGGGRRPSPAAR